MIKLNKYITEAWSGVKKYTNNAEIKAWCDEMGIEKYTINSKGEIDVNENVMLYKKDLKELPYPFGTVNGYFDIGSNPDLTSLKNCPDKVGDYFSCSQCTKLDSLEGCPKEVEWSFYCYDCKRNFIEKEVRALCKVKGNVGLKKY